MVDLAIKYGFLIFVAVVGTLQAAAAHSNLQGLLFFKNKRYAYLWAVVTVGSCLAVFFTWNYHFATGVIEGSQQAGMFAAAAFAALVFTLVASSLIQFRLRTIPAVGRPGLEALNHSNYFRAVLARCGAKK
jgi:hypothetical protein